MVKRNDHVVMVLDDDTAILGGLNRLLTLHGYQVCLYSAAADFFAAGMPEIPACLILDNHLGDGMTGLEIHAEMQRIGWDIPTVFLTAHWNVQSVVNAMRAGADGFLTKPFDPAQLLDEVAKALERAHARQQDGEQATAARAKAALLTEREREVVSLVVRGLLNKEIADQLDLALVTVKVHRGRAMQKLGAGNPAELARIASLAGLQ
jgi:FixJ family two-component response regulator